MLCFFIKISSVGLFNVLTILYFLAKIKKEPTLSAHEALRANSAKALWNTLQNTQQLQGLQETSWHSVKVFTPQLLQEFTEELLLV